MSEKMHIARNLEHLKTTFVEQTVSTHFQGFNPKKGTKKGTPSGD
jgi:hypothetical protein